MGETERRDVEALREALEAIKAKLESVPMGGPEMALSARELLTIHEAYKLARAALSRVPAGGSCRCERFLGPDCPDCNPEPAGGEQLTAEHWDAIAHAVAHVMHRNFERDPASERAGSLVLMAEALPVLRRLAGLADGVEAEGEQG